MNIALGATRLAMNALTPVRRIPNPFAPSLQSQVDGKVVVITGASRGIGRSLAERVAQAGATVVLVARREDELNEIVRGIEQRGGIAHAIAADLASDDGINHVADIVLNKFGAPDILVNNAGRSIMRSVAASEFRLHDYERTMRINYLAGVGLTLRFLPAMRARRSGHIVHSSSIGVIANLPRFSAYIGSKAALEAVLRCAEVESYRDNIKFTDVHIPLADTDMAAAAEMQQFRRLTLDEVTDVMVDAIRTRPRVVNNPLGSLYALTYQYAPWLGNLAQNYVHRTSPEQ
ncbi:SDR family NAD(P)-dependent oxidoreductase [Nocardia sp. NPDC057663]|uniref:SDR family NAD(P)-dependent oxidoreductase n=1 Tax=Nocardia sp. NPDC057663 TaxID=3346201 RepID=UPI00366D1874